ncbi:class C sortase [Anaerococcus degeneri]|uniref:Class C sortase n=1 Tax=Anaerococcus degeneri TaxID=361500 RepID=A0ABS7Z056_9FIRM|nr:class C sortase [Anaerococcus degeneri]MBP2015571.1 sortase A [Anaerococcus degeneri]MCA2095926.1 class C sortase [Anaerococcus degeneri]
MAKKKPKEKKVNKKKSRWVFRLIFLLGFLVMIYPLISRFYYRIESNEQVETFSTGAKKLDTKEIDRRINLAKAFNDSLSGKIASDPYTRKQQEEGRKEYARMLEVEEMIGTVDIPKINQKLPIYAGTSEDILQKGVGHLEGTSLPIGGNSSHTVLTAHSGLPEATLFTHLNQLEIGDKFYIENIEGIIAYQVDQIKVIEPSNFEDLMISPGHDYATLLTCTPIMINTHRLIVRGHRVPYVPAVDEELIRESRNNWIFRTLFFAALGLIILLIILILKLRRDNKEYFKKISEFTKGGFMKPRANTGQGDLFDNLADEDDDYV